MTEVANFADILDAEPTEVRYPTAIPPGTYITQLVGIPRVDKSSQKQTPFYEFTHRFISAEADVDQEALAAALEQEDGSSKSLSDVTMTNRFYHTPNSIWRLDEFFEHCGIELDGTKSRRQMAEASGGSTVGVVIKHTPTQDGTRTRAEIARTLRVE